MLTPEQREIVKRARERIANRENWCQHVFAFTADNLPCGFEDPRAVKFCAVGALAREYTPLAGIRALGSAGVLARRLTKGDSLAHINNGPDGHAKVLAIFDKALAE